MYAHGVNSQEIGKRLRLHRTRAPRISLARLADETKVLTLSRISNYEQGIRVLKTKEAQLLSAAFNRLGKPISAATLLGINDEEKSNQQGVGSLSNDEQVLVTKYRQMPSTMKTHYQEIGNTLASKKVGKSGKTS